MLHIQTAEKSDIQNIRAIALPTWQHTYRHIITSLQMEMMLSELLSEAHIARQMEDGQVFLLVLQQNIAIGFLSYELQEDCVFISKLYVSPEVQKSGAGKFLLEHARNIAIQQQKKYLKLYVNRYNKALYFYRRQGFYIARSTDRPYHQFELNDYELLKKI